MDSEKHESNEPRSDHGLLQHAGSDQSTYSQTLRNTLMRYPSLPTMACTSRLSTLGELHQPLQLRRASESNLVTSQGKRSVPQPTERADPVPEAEGLLSQGYRGGAGNEDVPPPSYADIMRSNDYVAVEDRRYSQQGSNNEQPPIALDVISPTLTDLPRPAADEVDRRASSPTRSGRGRRPGGPFPAMWHSAQSCFQWLGEKTGKKRARLIIGGCVIGALILLFLTLFPISFVYVEYHEIALEKSRSTGYVFQHRTYYPGCYVLSPDSILVRFDATGQMTLMNDMDVFVKEALSVGISLSFVYFLRGEEVGQLYDKYVGNYGEVINKVAEASIKLTGTEFSIDEIRLNREDVTDRLHRELQLKLGGDCCRKDCDFDTCNYLCTYDNCTQGLHVDVKHVYLTDIVIPPHVMSRYMNQLLLKEEIEKIKLQQQIALITKETLRQVEEVEFQADEILANATAHKHLLEQSAIATADQTTQSALFTGWKKLCDRLDLTNEDHCLSALLIKSLNERDDLLQNVGYPKAALFT